MAITSLRGNNTPFFFSRLKLLLNHQQRLAHAFSEAPQPRPKMVPEEGLIDMSKWKKIDSRVFGITRAMIPDSSYHVLRILRGRGFEAYLVGGCVRDLILKRVPKDFDVITTANLKEIKRQFHRSRIVGHRFPICMVNIKGSWIEVSSFETVANNHSDKEVTISEIPKGCGKKDFIRWRNSMHRDFTINSLFFDPISNKIYDYANGMADLNSLKLRSLVPAKLSFKEDCARILRGLRIAARLRLSISKETETAIHKCSSSILTLTTSRIMMEMNYMLSYGAAEPSLCLLWRFNLLKLLLPIHAAYLDQQSIRKFPQNSTMLMKLFSNLDKVVTVDRPSDCSLWVALLVVHMALVSHPQDALVVFSFASILYHGGCEKGLKSARDDAQVTVDYLPEISIPSACKSEEQLEKEVSRFASLVLDSIAALTATESLVEGMSKYPETPCSGVVFVPKRTAQGVAEIFRVLADDIKSYNTKRKSYVIDYPLLQKGFLCETSFVLGKIILETMGSGILKGEEVVQEDYGHLEQESIKEKCNKGKKRVHKSDTPELKQESAKERKLIEKKCRVLKEEMDIEKPEVLETLSPEEDIFSVLGPVEKKHKSGINGQSKRKMEKERQCISPDKTMKQQIKTVKKNNLNQKETLNLETILEDISENIPEDRQLRYTENGRLSSLFSGEKIQKRKEAADKGEKSSRPQLSSLFK
ncbi:PREDICTED: uncharacterized protein LOC101302293 isoform X2 [Fragaria vesca subsp. vesca]|uniref:uncharacterized protein LOC101302293 isoform X2 n=1 Tax=Fragaria vesca subsp. vesca TaxID=101020 RepID=UPI0002C33A2B|nr:PREDICTED: uncharacterized protein LOC101302293 isoform X2 [Fragaria vesca subsp. vesca]